jgi:hypothetical protein
MTIASPSALFLAKSTDLLASEYVPKSGAASIA